MFHHLPAFRGRRPASGPGTGASQRPGAQPAQGYVPNDNIGQTANNTQMRSTTQAMREAAASRQTQVQKGTNLNFAGINPATSRLSPLSPVGNTINGLAKTLAAMLPPNSMPDYFGTANWANSPLPTIDPATGGHLRRDAEIRRHPAGHLRAYPRVDQRPRPMHPDGSHGYHHRSPVPIIMKSGWLNIASSCIGTCRRPAPSCAATCSCTRLGQLPGVGTDLSTANGLTQDVIDPITGTFRQAYTKPHYLGPLIVATGCDPAAAGCGTVLNPLIPVRVKFTNLLPIDTALLPNAGDLFIPTDNTYMGAGDGSKCADGTEATPTSTCARATFSENRATLHLHGGNTPWISDGTPHQWTVPAGEADLLRQGRQRGLRPRHVVRRHWER